MHSSSVSRSTGRLHLKVSISVAKMTCSVKPNFFILLIIERIGRSPLDTFAFSCTVLLQPFVEFTDGKLETGLHLIGVDVEVCTAEVTSLVLDSDSTLADGTDFYIFNLGEFDSTGEPIGEKFNVFLILCVHRGKRLPQMYKKSSFTFYFNASFIIAS